MKKFLLPITILMGSLTFAQMGKVGVNTEKPTETLQVQGTVRITDLPEEGTANAIYTTSDGSASSSKDQPFVAQKYVVTDKNGVLGKIDVGGYSIGDVKTVNTNTNSSNNTVDYTNEVHLKGLYVMRDTTSRITSYSIYVNLPKNLPGTHLRTARVFRAVIIPVAPNFQAQNGITFKGNIGNTSINGNGVTVKSGENGYVTIGANNRSRFGGVITFIELDGKWFLDRNVQKD